MLPIRNLCFRSSCVIDLYLVIHMRSNPANTNTIASWWQENFAIDVRALACVRIGAAVLLLFDLLLRARDLTAHYTDDGVLPRAARIALTWDFCESWWLSLHMLSGSVVWQAALFALAGLAACALLVGYRTKVALFASWWLLLSLHGRFPMLLQGGDVLLRCLLFWMLFLPLNARFVWNGEPVERKRTGSVISCATIAIMSQLLMMYFFTALLKTSPLWTTNFHATYYALHIDHFTSSLGYALLAYPRLLQGMTAAALLLEFFGPLLLLMPFGQRYLRIGLPLVFIGFHLGLALCLDLGTFPWICILYWALFLPSSVWERGERFLTAWLGGKTRSYATATFITPHASLTLNCMAAFLLLYVATMNLLRLNNPLATVGRFPLNLVGKITGLEQYWNMFSPGPYEYGSWLRVEGVLANGTLVNLYAPHEPLPDTKPQRVSAMYPTQYWRRCMVTAYEFGEEAQQTALLRYFAQTWNRTHGAAEQVIEARLVHMIEPTPLPFSEPAESKPLPEKQVLRRMIVSNPAVH